jgi:hypothetical protein
MHTTAQLLELAKQRLSLAHNLPLPMTDYRLSKLLGVSTQVVSGWRTGTRGIGAEFAQKFADACELPSEYIYACIQHERAKNEQERSILERIAKQFRNVAAAIVAVGIFFALPCFTGSNDAFALSHDIHYAQFRRRLRRRLLALLGCFGMAFALTGCSTLRDPAELAWQSLHAADVAMTDHIVNDPCYAEGAPLTRALIGANPSHKDVTAWGIGTAAIHLGVSHLLREDHPTGYKIWQAITITDTAASIGKGWSIGVRFGGTNKRQNCGATLSP